ncbi:MAG: hypothetical protein HKN91_09995 [Acidimicrobiia bacterium]|nr:hypothetical protein [Acidimicrobiia bacterium]
MIEAVACAKVNFSLRVGAVEANGLHRVSGLFQSIDWIDRLTAEWSEEDEIVSMHGGPVIAEKENLAWRAAELMRREAGSDRRLRIALHKNIPAAAGLGGGSADAAAALAAVGYMFGVAPTTELAAQLGSDVPFCLQGGTAEVGATGETVSARDLPTGFALGLVVPPVEISTADVFAEWDALGAPEGRPIGGTDLPPALRSGGPLINDLHPAAAAVAPILEEWRIELEARWGRPVLVTGSGPTLFAFFLDRGEATAAIDAIPPGARAATAAEPVPFGWVARDGSKLWASTTTDESSKSLAASLFDG